MDQYEDLEKLRLKFKPATIALLLVGESPPPQKGFFFDTSVAEGQLSRNTRIAFQDHYKTQYSSREEFLSQFKAKQCYLTDLLQQRGKTVQKADMEEKQAAQRQLTSLLQEEKPRIVAPVLKRIRRLTEQLLEESRIHARLVPLTYPTRQYIPEYQSGLQIVLSLL
jgi:arsenate reductase-like glutaredoxin family protein